MTVQYDKLIDIERLGAFKGMCDDEYAAGTHTHSYAGAPTSGGNAHRSNAILYGTVDGTSTATAFTATVAGLTQLQDGTCVMLKNGVVTSAAGFTIDVNNLGAKPVYTNLAAATAESTKFNVNYTLLFVYDSTRVSGGCWVCYNGYDSNTNTIGYQVRTNSGNKTAADTGYRYRIWLTSADGSKWVPINTSTSTNATSNRTLNTRAIDPFGPIVYRSTNGTCNSGSGIGATGIWQQYTLSIGYSYMASGFSLSFPDSVYLRCTPQADGSAVMQDIVQALPSSKDGKIYINLGTAYSATDMELQTEHPVYWHDGTGIRIWTGAEPSSSSSVEPSSTTPSMDGTAAVGSSDKYAREDHVHPTDTSRVAEQTIDTVKGKTATITNSNGAISITTVQGASASQGITINGLVTPSSNYMPTTKLYVDTSRQATLVSGTNIKTINNTSLLGSGNIAIPALPSVTSSDNGKVLSVVNGAWTAASPSGSSVSYYTTNVTLPTSGWANNSITVNVVNMAASSDVIVSPAPASAAEWASCGILCTAQGAGTLTFTRTNANANALIANVIVFGGGDYVMLYNITLLTTKLNVNKTTAMPGETVTITNPLSTPMSSIVYKTGDKNTVVLAGATMAAGTTRTFTMPAFDVSIANTTK